MKAYRGSLFLCLALLAAAYFCGHHAAMAVNAAAVREETSKDWGLGFGENNSRPKGNESAENLQQYNAYYIAPSEEKILYLTFDCGYENGNTDAILDALQKHGVKATFFVVGHFLESAPGVANRMVQEGHSIGNHTYHHPGLSTISTKEALAQELRLLEETCLAVTGTEPAKLYRPPQGKYSFQHLQNAKELGYSTIFWSLAYADWDTKNQPDEEDAIEKLTKRIHPGAIVLLHNTSATNGKILDRLLTTWEDMGYSFGTLSMLTEGKNTESTKIY